MCRAFSRNFARLACATGGSYQYATAPNDLRNFYNQLADTVPAAYEVQGQVIALADPELSLDNGCYRLATGVEITMAGTQVTIQLAGDKTAPAILNAVIDDRLVVCKRPVPDDGAGDGDAGDGGGNGSEE